MKVPKDLADVLQMEWITDARQEETRKRRIAESFQMIRQGVGKEDKYRGS